MMINHIDGTCYDILSPVRCNVTGCYVLASKYAVNEISAFHQEGFNGVIKISVLPVESYDRWTFIGLLPLKGHN